MTQDKVIQGGCLCGNVRFEVRDTFEHFQLCHCTQCQKTTGSAHASNLFTQARDITWLAGQDQIKRYDVPGRRISNAFCTSCGSRVPWYSLSKEIIAVPAGSLDEVPAVKPQANIFWPERAAWYDEGIKAQSFNTYMD